MSVGGVARPAGDAFNGRFFLVSYLPTYAAAVYILVLVWAGAPGQDIQFGRAWKTAAALSGGEILLLAVAITLGALLLHPLQLALVRIIEGYWPAWLTPLTRALLRRQRKRHARLANAAQIGSDEEQNPRAILSAGIASTRLRRLYPAASDVRPTTLGNVLTAMEGRAGAEYGWDAVVAWPRLYPVLGEQVRAVVDDRRNTMDAVARLSVVATMTGLVTVALLAQSGWWLLLALAPLGVGWLAYRSAVQAALAYAEAVDVAFDLHRFDLLKALHLDMPADQTAERETAAALSGLWRQGKPVRLEYHHDDQK